MSLRLKDGGAAEGVKIQSDAFHALQTKLFKALVESCAVESYFTDRKYEIPIKLDRNRFLGLFNFQLIKASCPLDDTSDDSSGALSKRLVKVTQESDGWKKTFESLPGQVLGALAKTNIREVTAKESLTGLNDVISSISKTNGASESNLSLSFEVSEDDATDSVYDGGEAKAIRRAYWRDMGGGVSSIRG